MSTSILKSPAGTLLGVLVFVFTLAGCGGDDGDDGAPGAPGAGAVRTVDSATRLVAEITDVSIDAGSGETVVEFRLSNQDGVAVVGISNVRFSIAKLIGESNGDSSRWQNYINNSRSPTTSIPVPGTEDKVQATNERGGTLVDNNDGTYRYTFSNDITNVTSPIPVSFDPAATHRVAMQINADANLPTANAVYTFQPSTGATTGITTRDVVITDSCNECHGTLALHGGGRIDTRYCVTCHNPGSADPDSGNTVDFKVMIHKIHRGANLPSVADGGESYIIWGFRNREHDYSEVHFPQDIRGCAKCHDENDAATPQAVNWKDRPTREACGSCHDDINFTASADADPNPWNRAHPGDVQSDNTACITCHRDGGAAGSVADSHFIPEREATARYGFEITDITSASGGTMAVAPGEAPIVTFRALNPQDDSNYVLATDAGWPNGRITLRAAWSTTDYANVGTAKGNHAPIDASVTIASSTPNPDGTYTVTFADVVPATATGSGVITIEGRASEDLDNDGAADDRVPVKASVAFFAITDAAPVARRSTVDIANCDKCHEQLSLHGDNRTDEPQLCVVCHNNNRTDIAARPADPDPGTPDVNEATVDGKIEESVDFKRLIHGVHGSSIRENDLVAYGFGGPFVAADEVHFPGVLNNCLTCHLDGSFELPLDSDIGATTVSSGADRDDPSDDLNITPTAAACSSCHDSTLAQAHMEQNGAMFAATEAELAAQTVVEMETCAICHGPGRIADVRTVHGID